MSATPLAGSTFFGLDISRLGYQLTSMRRRVSKRVLVLEFGVDLLRLAEACLTQQGVQLNHISSVALPPEALDRGVPAEPAKMASLLQQICTEKKIPAHRVAVVLPPEVAFQRLVDLPGELTTEEAREYVLDPAKGVQLPFPLAQTDFDLVPMSTPSIAQRAPGMRLYMLSAVPQVLVDKVIEMLQAADLELQLLELGSLSQLRSLALDLVTLAPDQVELVLELRPDCSNLMLATCSGLLGSERLAAIRDFPEPELDEQQTMAALEAEFSAESLTVQDESYLPISDLDLRVLIADLKAALARFNAMFPGAEIRCLQLTGINSAHPMLVDLLKQALGIKVLAHRPLLAPGIAGFAADEVLVQTGLCRLVGLALGLLNKDQLVMSPVDGLDNAASSPNLSGVAIEELLDLDVQSSELGLVPGASSQPVSAVVAKSVVEGSAAPSSSPDPLTLTNTPQDQKRTKPSSDDEDEAVFSGVLDLLGETTQWPTVSGVAEAVVGEEERDELSVGEEEWPSIGGAVGVEAGEELKGEVDVEDEKWPTVSGVAEAVVGEEERDELSVGEEEWPSIGDAVGVEAGEELKGEVDVEDEKWPTVGGVAEAVVGEEERDELSVGEEEWPSIGGVVEAYEDEGSDGERSPSAVKKDGKESLAQALESDPSDEDSLFVIPGLALGADADLDKQQDKKTRISEEPVDAQQESLGELRFSDPE